MKRIEIVTHVYAKVLPHYAQALTYQLSSLNLYRSKAEVSITICLDMTDAKTVEVLLWFGLQCSFPIKIRNFPIERLGRRAIGRNVVAKETEADIIWFTDVDYLFRDGCLDAVADFVWPEKSALAFPHFVQMSHDHELGDSILSEASYPQLVDIDPKDFYSHEVTQPPGGCFIIKGDFAREHGYLPGHKKYQSPTDGVFLSCKCDVPYRSYCKRNGDGAKVIEIPNVFRIRHTKTAHKHGAQM